MSVNELVEGYVSEFNRISFNGGGDEEVVKVVDAFKKLLDDFANDMCDELGIEVSSVDFFRKISRISPVRDYSVFYSYVQDIDAENRYGVAVVGSDVDIYELHGDMERMLEDFSSVDWDA